MDLMMPDWHVLCSHVIITDVLLLQQISTSQVFFYVQSHSWAIQ